MLYEVMSKPVDHFNCHTTINLQLKHQDPHLKQLWYEKIIACYLITTFN